MNAAARWEFATAGRIVFGRGCARDVPALAAGLGRRPLVVTGATPSRFVWLLDALAAQGQQAASFAVGGEPDLPLAVSGADVARQTDADVVVAIGGGSVLDAGKAIAAFAGNPGDPLDYLEVVGRGLPLPFATLPVVAVPTTAGTGSEVTRNAVLRVPESQVKVSLRAPQLLPRVAVVDPDLTLDLPSTLTAYTGLDALTQNIEPFLSPRATPMTDAVCRDGIPRAARSLRAAFGNGKDAGARTDMALASLCGGLALANAGLGAVHGLAGPIGGMFDAPHGAVCAALLPGVFAANLEALTTRAPEHPALGRMDDVASWLVGDPRARARDGVAWLDALVRDLAVPPLSAWGVTQADVSAVVSQAARSSSMAGNPVVLTPDELTRLVAAAAHF